VQPLTNLRAAFKRNDKHSILTETSTFRINFVKDRNRIGHLLWIFKKTLTV